MPWSPTTSRGGAGSGAGGLVKLFDSTLGGAATNIDTGANGIASGHADLYVLALIQTTEAVSTSTAAFTVNGDTAAHYDYANMDANSAAPVSGRTAAATRWLTFCAGATNQPYPSIVRLDIPSYDKTTLNKVAMIQDGMVDQGAGQWALDFRFGGWRSTAAINQLTVTAGAGNLIAGSRLVIYGTQ